MKMKVIISIIMVLVIIISVILIVNYNKNEKNEDRINELYNYGNKLETMDVLPNTVVARFNGEEILFREIETARKSINYSIKNGNKESEGKNAFYEVLTKKLYIELAKKYPDEVKYNLNINNNLEKTKKEWLEGYGEKSIEEYRKEFLDILCIKEDEIWLNEDDFLTYLQSISINHMLEIKGTQIIVKFMLEKPELANNKILEEKVRNYNELQKRQNQINVQNNVEEMITSIEDGTKLLIEIRELYIKNLIINSNIELCLDKGELSTKVPEIYIEDN